MYERILKASFKLNMRKNREKFIPKDQTELMQPDLI